MAETVLNLTSVVGVKDAGNVRINPAKQETLVSILAALGSVPVTQSTSPWVVSGTVAATQSGSWSAGRTWTLSSSTDTVASVQSGSWAVGASQTGTWTTGRTWSLSETTDSARAYLYGYNGVGIAGDLTTNALQVKVVNLPSALNSVDVTAWFGSAAPTVGQKAMAASIPVVLPSDQSLTVNLSNVDFQIGAVEIKDGTTDTRAVVSVANGLVVDVSRVQGTVAVTQSTSPWVVSGTITATASGTQDTNITQVNGTTQTARNWSTDFAKLQNIPTSPSTDRTTAAAPFSVELSDGASFYTGTKTGQLPTSLVGGRLDSNVGAWLGSTAPTVGSKTSANSVPVVIASDQATVPVSLASVPTHAVTQSGTWTVQPGNTANTTAWLVTGTGGTFPATQSGTWTTGRTWTLASGTDSVAAVQSGTWNVNATLTAETTKVIGTVNQGTSPWVTSRNWTLASGTDSVTAVQSGTWAQNITQVNGNAVLAGNGVTGTGSLRVTIASDNTAFSVNAAQSGAPWSFNQTQVNGIAVSTGNGVVGTGVQRVAIASDNTAFSVNATLSAETTKVIGTVNQGTSPWVVSGTVTSSGAGRDDTDNQTSVTTGLVLSVNRLYGYDGTDWDRLVSSGTNNDAQTAVALGYLRTGSFGYAYNGTNWDRMRTAGVADGGTGTGLSASVGFLQGADSLYYRFRGDNASNDGLSGASVGLTTNNRLYGWNGSTWDRSRAGDVNNVASATGYLDSLAVARYNATQPTLTDTRYNALQVSSRGELLIAKGVTGFSIDNTTFAVTQSGTWTLNTNPQDINTTNLPGTFTVTTTATLITGAGTNTDRRRIRMRNTGGQTAFIGNHSSLTLANATIILPTGSVLEDDDVSLAYYSLTALGTTTLAVEDLET